VVRGVYNLESDPRMLPLLPALILLILQGPANIERLACDGHLPAALKAIHRHMRKPEAKEADNVLLASLLAVSSDREMSEALQHLLALTSPPEEPQVATPAPEPEASPPISAPAHLGAPQDGHGTSQRSRDGPF